MRIFGLTLLRFNIKLIHTVFSIFMIILFAKRSKKPVKKQNEECLILGNGPSLVRDLKGSDINLSDKTLICVNFFANSDLYLDLKPSVYVFLDPIFWANSNRHELRDQKVIDICNELFERISSTTTWPLEIYAPHALKKSDLFKKCKNNQITFRFFNSIPSQGFDSFVRFSLQHGLGLLKAANVMIPAIHYAIISGFKTVYLSGVDHSWLNSITVSEDCVLQMAQPHFDDKELKYKPLYLLPTDKSPAKLHELLEVYSHVFRNYWILSDLASRNQSRVLNLTNESFIDAFPKVKLSK